MFTEWLRPRDISELQPINDAWIWAFSQDRGREGGKEVSELKTSFLHFNIFPLFICVSLNNDGSCFSVLCPFLLMGPKDPPSVIPTAWNFTRSPQLFNYLRWPVKTPASQIQLAGVWTSAKGQPLLLMTASWGDTERGWIQFAGPLIWLGEQGFYFLQSLQ